MADRNFDSQTLYIRDNLDVLRGMNSETVDLVATDPPFNKSVRAFEGPAGSFKDTWDWQDDVHPEWVDAIREKHQSLHVVIEAARIAAGEDMAAYLCWLGVRVLEIHRVLKPTGSLYLHIDHTAHAWVKAMLDAILGRAQFRNEIVWCYFGPSNVRRNFPRKHDTILWYSKSGKWKFNPEDVRVPYKILVGTPGGKIVGDRHDQSRVDALRTKGKVVEDYWTDIHPVVNQREKTGYPTQKPLALYERIIQASSNPGDLVLDPFAGCATTCVAAERLGRQWVGIDIDLEAANVTLTRLQVEVEEGMTGGRWSNEYVAVEETPPERTDDAKPAAPELVLLGQTQRSRSLPVAELRALLVADVGRQCQGCGFKPPHEDYLQIDHKQPKSLGGKDSLDNRTLLCGPCNGKKSNRLTLSELRDVRQDEGRFQDSALWERIVRERERERWIRA